MLVISRDAGDILQGTEQAGTSPAGDIIPKELRGEARVDQELWQTVAQGFPRTVVVRQPQIAPGTGEDSVNRSPQTPMG